MANEAEQAIYNRLASAPSFHPASVDLFVPDWTLEPGDVVLVSSGNETYNVPVYSMQFDWKGANGGESKAQVQSTGNQKREPLPALQRRGYGYGSGTYAVKKELEEKAVEYETHFVQTDREIGSIATASGVLLTEDGYPVVDEHGEYVFSETGGTLYATVLSSASQIRSEVGTSMSGVYSAITQTASQIRSEVNTSMSGVYSSITQTASQIRSEVASSISAAQSSIIEQTDSHIRTEVSSAVSGIYDSVIEQTGSYIRSEISAAASGITQSVIEQTGSYIRTEIANAASGVYASVIEQTESTIRTEVATKSKIYVQWTDPALDASNEVQDGDLWVKTNSIRTWGQAQQSTWGALSAYQWQDYYGAIQYVRRNGAWEKINNEQQEVIQGTRLTQTEEAITLQAANLEGYHSEFVVEASQIRGEVSDSNNQLHSEIVQTASQIRSEVSNSLSGVQSSITQNANRIALVVNTSDNSIKAAQIVSAINDAGSNVIISADHIQLDGNVTAAGKFTVDSSGYLVVKSGAVIQGQLSLSGTSGVIAPFFTASGGGYLRLGGSSGGEYYDLTAAKLNAMVTDLQIILSGNTYTLQKRTCGRTTWEDVGNFSRATTLSGSWSGSTYTVTASPQGNTRSQTLYLSPSGGGTAGFSVGVYHTDPTVPANRVLTNNVYLVENVSSKLVEGRWGSSTGTAYAQVSTASTYNAGHNQVQGSDVIMSRTQGGGVGSEITYVPDSAINKSNGAFSGYVWLKEADGGTYKNLRTFNFAMPTSADGWTKSWVTGSVYQITCTVAGKAYTTTMSF